MIINTEVTNGVDAQGRPSKVLVISYVRKDGQTDLITYAIPEHEFYKWEYAKKGSVIDAEYKSWDFKPVTKVRTKSVSEARVHEIMVELTDAFPERMNVLYEMNSPDMSFCDIEVNVTDDGFPDAKSARNQVNTISWVHGSEAIVFGLARLTDDEIMWCQEEMNRHCKDFKDDYTFQYFYYNSEISMLEDFMFNYFAKASCITGWNFFGYDYPYLYNRCEKLGIDISCISPTRNFTQYTPYFAAQNGRDERIRVPMHKLLFDYMEVFAKWDRSVDPKENNKLDWVSGKVLGTKKVEHNLGFKEFWEQKPKEYVFYNAVDSILVREIDRKIHTANALFALATITHIPVLNAFSAVRTLETVQVEYLHRENRVVPTDMEKTKSEGYEGAFVYDPIPGSYKNAIALDFRSLYPTTEIQFNISPDTFIEVNKDRAIAENEIATVSGAIYRRDFQGIIPKLTQDFFDKRRSFQKRMKAAENEYFMLLDVYKRRFKKEYSE